MYNEEYRMMRGQYILTVLVVLLSILGCKANKPAEDEDMFQKGLQHAMNVEYDEAYRCFSIARTLYHVMGNQEKEMQALMHMASCAFYAGELDSCIFRLNQALDITHKTRNVSEEYSIYSDLYDCYSLKGDMGLAMKMRLNMDSVADISSDSRTIFLQLNRLAQEAAGQHNTKLQEYYLLKSEDVLKDVQEGERKSMLYIAYGNLRDFYENIQDYKKARIYSGKYIDLSMSKTEKNGFDYLVYTNEAILSAKQKNRYAAFAAIVSMKDGLEHCKDVPAFLWMYYHEIRGNVYTIFEEWENACDAYKESLEAVKGENLSTWYEYHNIIYRLAAASTFVGDFDRARRCLHICATYWQQQYGYRSKEYSDVLCLLAKLEGSQGNIEKGCDYYIQSSDITKRIVAEQLRYVSVQQRDTFWMQFAPIMQEMSAYAYKNNKIYCKFTEKCYDALLFSKALLLESDRSMASAINAKCSPEKRRIYYEMVNLQKEAKEMMKNYEKNKERLDILNRRISVLDKQLTPIISQLGYTSFLELSYQDIKKSLDDNEVLLDFTDFPESYFRQYIAFFVSKRQKYPLLLRSIYDKTIDYLLDGRPIDHLYSQSLSKKVMEHIWKPLSKNIKRGNIVYYVPSGVFHQISLESLPMNDGTRLGEHYHFVRLSSAREIVRMKNRSSAGTQKQATLYGGLKYDMDGTEMVKASSNYKVNNLLAMTRGGVIRGEGKWGELKNTKEEVDAIGQLLIKKKVHTTSMTGVKGTEESFFAMSGKAPQILHIATHGFYYTPENAKEVSYLNGYQDAMQLTGLIMSGGNSEWTGKPIPKGVMGGVLTANDIATLDLRGTDLVVLSACQTGLGKVTPEGLYGLQRAFKKAGVQTIIMTLWNVSDVATKEFMVKFYEELTAGADRWNKRKAFENAKNHIRNNQDYKDPYYWAGFVMLD